MVNVDAARRTRRKHRLRYLRVRPLSQAGRKKKLADTYTFFAQLSSSSREIIAPVAGQTYSELYIIFDKAAAPTASFVNQGEANYQHGYRIYANGLPKSEKTALYVVPSNLNDRNMRYGVTYLPGIGITQAIYGDARASSIGNLFYLTLTLPYGGVQWTDDMPTEWYIKDSEGWQDLGLLNVVVNFSDVLGDSREFMFYDNATLEQNITFFVIVYNPFNWSDGYNRLIIPWPDNSDHKDIITFRNEGDIFDMEGSQMDNSIPIQAYGVSNTTGTTFESNLASESNINLRNNIWPAFIFDKMLTPVV